jgi:hypothetical protein
MSGYEEVLSVAKPVQTRLTEVPNISKPHC